MRNRAAVKRRLTEIALHAFAEPVQVADGRFEQVRVSYTWDGGAVNVPTFFLGVTSGRSEATSIPGPSTYRSDDRFTVSGYLTVPGFAPDDAGAMAAEEAAEKCLNVFEAALRSCRGGSLVNADIDSAMDPAEYRVQNVTITDMPDGPGHGYPDAQSASYSGGLSFVIDCTSLIS